MAPAPRRLTVVGLLPVWLMLAAPASAQTTGVTAAAPGAAPPALNIVHVRLKAGTSAAYESLEASIVRAWQRARIRVYWVALQSPKDAKDVLYLNLLQTPADVDRAAAAYAEAVKQHPELVKLQQRLTEFTSGSTSTLTTHRDEVEHTPGGVDFATMRMLQLTTFQVTPGREGDFITAIRTANAKEAPWLVYEANDAPTFVLITLKRSVSDRLDAPAIPRTLRRFRGVYTKAETRIYAVRPAMSRVSRAFAAANPQFWRAAGADQP
jgi:hypothetical protein